MSLDSAVPEPYPMASAQDKFCLDSAAKRPGESSPVPIPLLEECQDKPPFSDFSIPCPYVRHTA